MSLKNHPSGEGDIFERCVPLFKTTLNPHLLSTKHLMEFCPCIRVQAKLLTTTFLPRKKISRTGKECVPFWLWHVPLPSSPSRVQRSRTAWKEQRRPLEGHCLGQEPAFHLQSLLTLPTSFRPFSL